MNEQIHDIPSPEHSHVVTASRRVNGPVEHVWKAWTDPVQLEHWFTEQAELQLSVGGRYTNSDGDTGEFLEIVPLERLKFTWEQPDYAAGGVVTVEMAPDGDNATTVRLEHVNIACDDTEDLEIGWNWSLDSLCAFIDRGLGLRFEEWAAGKR